MNLEQPPDSELFNTMSLIFFLTIVLASIWGIILWWGIKEARAPHNQLAPQASPGLILPYLH